MSSSIPLQIAETIQTASIKRHPDVDHDVNPSTAASQKTPVMVSHHDSEDAEPLTSLDRSAYDEVDELDDVEDDEEDIPYDVIRPIQRRKSLPPLPDLRFEQSYLASIAGADTYWKVAYITMRDQVSLKHLPRAEAMKVPLVHHRNHCANDLSMQVLFPLVQGTLWSLGLHGWRYWNRSAQLSGNSTGARIRRWWWKTNNWEIKEKAKEFVVGTQDMKDPKYAEMMGEVQ